MLCSQWGINAEEWKFIDSKIKAIELINVNKNID